MKQKKNIFKTKLFYHLFGIPSSFWLMIALIAILPEDTEEIEPLTEPELFIITIVLLLLWFIVSTLLTFIITKLKNKYHEKTNKKNTIMPSRTISNLMTFLFFMTITCFFGICYFLKMLDVIFPQYPFDLSKHMWIFWCGLPIPILSIILGFKLKKINNQYTRNIVSGFIVTIILFVFGSFSFILPSISQYDYKNIYQYQNIIDGPLPNSGILTIQKWETDMDEDKTNYLIIHAYYKNTNEFDNYIKHNSNWILSTNIKSKLKIMLPSSLHSDPNTYFSIYNETLAEYNKIPNVTGQYVIYTMKYNISSKHLEIHKFKYFYRDE